MRITTTLFVCSTLGACMPAGPRCDEFSHDSFCHPSPDAGSNTTVQQTCTSPTNVSGDLTITNGDFSMVPTTCWTLGGKLTITGPMVTSLDKLGTLQSVGSLVIYDTYLTKLDTKQPVAVAGDISIYNNANLADISNLAPATTINSLRLDNDASLTNLGKLSSVTTVLGAVSVQNNLDLTAVDLSAVSRIEGALTIATNPMLTTMHLQALQSVYDFKIESNAALASIGSLAALQYVHGTFTIDGNAGLLGLDDAMLNPLTAIDSGLTITNNGKLTTLGQLARAGLSPSMTISNNASLPWCTARDVGCCVNHVGTANLRNNRDTGSCNSNSWCYPIDNVNGGCYQYTNN